MVCTISGTPAAGHRLADNKADHVILAANTSRMPWLKSLKAVMRLSSAASRFATRFATRVSSNCAAEAMGLAASSVAK